MHTARDAYVEDREEHVLDWMAIPDYDLPLLSMPALVRNTRLCSNALRHPQSLCVPCASG